MPLATGTELCIAHKAKEDKNLQKLCIFNRKKKELYNTTHVIFGSATDGAALALDALPPVALDSLHHFLGELEAGRVAGPPTVGARHHLLRHARLLVVARVTETEVTVGVGRGHETLHFIPSLGK